MAAKSTHIANAQKYLQKGQRDRAIKEYYRALDSDPRDLRIRHKLGELLASQGIKSEALKELNLVAEAHSKGGFYLKAVAVYKQMLRTKHDLYDVHLKLGELYHKLSLNSEAMEHLRIVADYYEQNGTALDCIEVYRQIVEINPEETHYKLKLAEYLVREGHNDEAYDIYADLAADLEKGARSDELMRVYERMVQLSPGAFDIQRALARLYLSASEPRRALARLQVCFKANATDPETLNLLGETFMALQQRDKAKAVYKELARIHAYQGFPDKQREVLERLRRIDPRDPDVQHLSSSSDDDANIITLHRDASSVAPSADRASDGEGDEERRGIPNVSEERSPEPEVGTPAGLRRIPESLQRAVTELETYIRYGLSEKARAHFTMMMERAPDSYAIRDKYRRFLLTEGDKEEAASQSARLSQIAASAGAMDQARQDLEKAVDLMPDVAEYRHALAALKQMTTRRDAASSETREPPFYQTGSSAQVDIQVEDEELVDDSDLGNAFETTDFLEEGMLTEDTGGDAALSPNSVPSDDPDDDLIDDPADDGDAIHSIYLSLSSAELDMDEAVAEANQAVERYEAQSAAERKAENTISKKEGEEESGGGEGTLDLSELVDGGDSFDLIHELELELGVESVSLTENSAADKVTRAIELADAFYHMHLYREALKELELCRGDAQGDFRFAMLHARCHFKLDRLDEAVRLLQAILNRNDLKEEEELEALFELAAVYEAQHEFQMALDLLEEISGVNAAFRTDEVRKRMENLAARLEDAPRSATHGAQ